MGVKIKFDRDGYYKVYDKVTGDIDIAGYDVDHDILTFTGCADEYKADEGRWIPIEYIMGPFERMTS